MSESENDCADGYAQLMVARNRKQRTAGGWQALGLDYSVFKGVQKKGYRQPTPIQRKTIPAIIDGKDVVAMSRTGSGKTAAFVVPMLQKLKKRELTGARALLIAPTRELALQTFKVIKELGRFTGLRCALLVGGDRIEEQFSVIHQHPDIIIATPGRLVHLLIEMSLKLSTIQYLVFDEADRLFEMGFADQLHEVIRKLPDNRQTLLFSATLPKMLVDFAKAGLSDPMLVRLDVDEKISDQLSMIFLLCRVDDKISALLCLIRTAIENNEMTIVFCATMKHVEYLAHIMHEAHIDSVMLYSQLDAIARKINIEKFRSKQCLVLIVTDVAARGVDIPLLDIAINFHFPPKAKLFVHRVGRVARAGKSGRAYSLISADELPYLADLFLYLGQPINFASPTSTYKEHEPLVGKFSDELIDLETDFLKSIHENSNELIELRQKCANAMCKYGRTRPQPSAESVRRTKMELREAFASASIHPILRQNAAITNDDESRLNLIQELHNFKPHTTIFEIQSSSKATSAAVMKAKRKAHQRYVNEHQQKSAKVMEATADGATGNAPEVKRNEDLPDDDDDDDDDMEEAFRDVIRNSRFRVKDEEALKAKKRKRNVMKKSEELEKEKREHFIAYAPSDAASERALAVHGDGVSFDKEAKANIIDICADDIHEMHKQQQQKKWDRKRKRFVGESGDNLKKRVRTEDGGYVAASYRSGRYEKWQNQQKTRYRETNDGGSPEREGAANTAQHFRGMRRNQRLGAAGVGIRGKNASSGSNVRSELKNPDQILKLRRKRESKLAYQTHRREENLKRKSKGRPGGGGRGGGGGGDGARRMRK